MPTRQAAPTGTPGQTLLLPGALPGLCEPSLYVDGFPVSQPRLQHDGRSIGVIIDSVVRIADVVAVEVHTRATSTPLMYGGTGAACGVVLIWTKGG